MRIITKHELHIKGPTEFDVPEGRVLKVIFDRGSVCLWIMHAKDTIHYMDIELIKDNKIFDELKFDSHLGSAVAPSGTCWHVFRRR